MTTVTKCRRCAECRDNSHHWIPNINFGVKEDSPQWICKHCPSKGEECPACYGFGNSEMDGSGDQCAVCDAEGVIPVAVHRQLKEAVRECVHEILEHWDEWEAEAGQEAQRHQLPEAGSFVMEARLSVEIENAIFKCWRIKK